MTIRYVGIGGNDGNSGLTWALRKLTLNGAEDTPVVAGDVVYVGPGVYREELVIDVAGNAANRITYIGDVTGEHTDGVGGIVRITGSDDDQTPTRSYCIIGGAGDNYRTFRGFFLDTTDGNANIYALDCTNWIIEDCVMEQHPSATNIWINGASQKEFLIRRCVMYGGTETRGLWFNHSSPVDDAGHVVENCVFMGRLYQLLISRVGGILINGCTFLFNRTDSVIINAALTVGQTVEVYNSSFFSGYRAFNATVLGEIIEDYNNLAGLQVPRTNTVAGANSTAYPPLLLPFTLFDGIRFPFGAFEYSEWSELIRRYDAFDDVGKFGVHAGISVIDDDLFGIYRPTGVSLLSWGAIQIREGERETGTKRTGSAAIILESAGDHQLFVPVTNVETTIEVYVYREANYEGLAPQMIIRQPDQDDEVVTDTGASGAWNQLTKTFTPAALPPYVCVILRSHNTALAGNYNTFFDDLDVI